MNLICHTSLKRKNARQFNATEINLGTNHFIADTDSEGLSDFDEVNRDFDSSNYSLGINTDPLNPDTDGDGIIDGDDPRPLSEIHIIQIPILSTCVLVLAYLSTISIGWHASRTE